MTMAMPSYDERGDYDGRNGVGDERGIYDCQNSVSDKLSSSHALTCCAFWNADPAFVTKFSSVHVSPDNQNIAGTAALVSATVGLKTLKFMGQPVEVDGWEQRISCTSVSAP